MSPIIARRRMGGAKWRAETAFDALPSGLLTLPAGAAVDVSAGALRGLTRVANGYELVTNGDFASSVGWSINHASWDIGTGVASNDGSNPGNATISRVIGAVIGHAYATRYTIVARTAGKVALLVGGWQVTLYRAVPGTYDDTITPNNPASNNQIFISCEPSSILSVDDISAQLIVIIPHLLCPSPNMRLTAAMPMPAAPSVVPRSIWVRGADELNGWEVRITPNTAGNDLSIIEWVAGVQTPRASADVDWTAGAVDNVKVETHANAITVFAMKDGAASWTQVATWATMATGALNRLFGFMVYDTAQPIVNSATWEAI